VCNKQQHFALSKSYSEAIESRYLERNLKESKLKNMEVEIYTTAEADHRL